MLSHTLTGDWFSGSVMILKLRGTCLSYLRSGPYILRRVLFLFFKAIPVMKINSSRGFTLIELIVVIVIPGILAAVAAPKFMDLQSDAKAVSRLSERAGSGSEIF